jgi:hypothetical protein
MQLMVRRVTEHQQATARMLKHDAGGFISSQRNDAGRVATMTR